MIVVLGGGEGGALRVVFIAPVTFRERVWVIVMFLLDET